MDPFVPSRRLNLELISNKKWTCYFAVPVDHREKIKESKYIDEYMNLVRELKKAGELGGGGNTNNCCAWNSSLGLRKEIGGDISQQKNRDLTDYGIKEYW